MEVWLREDNHFSLVLNENGSFSAMEKLPFLFVIGLHQGDLHPGLAAVWAL